MKKTLLTSAALLLILLGFQNCGKLMGTDTGNPMNGNTSISGSIGQIPNLEQNLALKICEIQIVCNPSISYSACYNAVFALPGLAAKFGGPAGVALKDMTSAPRVDLMAHNCLLEIDALRASCSSPAVTGAYDAQTASFAGTLNMVPAAGDCPKIY